MGPLLQPRGLLRQLVPVLRDGGWRGLSWPPPCPGLLSILASPSWPPPCPGLPSWPPPCPGLPSVPASLLASSPSWPPLLASSPLVGHWFQPPSFLAVVFWPRPTPPVTQTAPLFVLTQSQKLMLPPTQPEKIIKGAKWVICQVPRAGDGGGGCAEPWPPWPVSGEWRQGSNNNNRGWHLASTEGFL